MADRPTGERGEGKSDSSGGVPPRVPPVVPPVVRPVVPPTVPPVAKPVVPPTVAPVVRPVVPPTVAPVIRPVVPPSVAPVLKPITPVRPPTLTPVAPVIKPISPGAPVMKPISPGAPPAMQPVATGSGRAGPGGGAAKPARESGDDARGGRPRESRGPSGAPAGMGLGPKVGLLTGLVTALCLALAVLPGLKGGGAADDDDGDFHAAGMNTAIALGTGLGGVSASSSSAAPSAQKPLESLAADLEAQIKELNLGGATRDRVTRVLAALRAGLAGKVPTKEIDALISSVTDEIKKSTGDEEKLKPLREMKQRLIKISEEFEKAGAAAGTAPKEPKAATLSRPGGASPFVPSAAWVEDLAGKVLAQSEPGVALPKSDKVTRLSPANANYYWYEAAVNGVACTIFGAPTGEAGRISGRVYVAIPTPPTKAGSAGGGSKLGLLMLILGPLLTGALGWMLAGSHGKPIKDLARELDRLGSSGDPGRRIAAHGPEANSIARSVERMVSNLKFRSQHEMADLQEVVSKEQGTAAEIHHGLMPKNPPRIGGYEVETLFKPGFEIGGDHFDYFNIDDDHLGVILLDTSVRGIPAAVVMSMARAYVRSFAPGVLSPAAVLMKVNKLLAADLSQGQYVTALYVIIDTSNGTAKVASAGHLPLVVYRHAIGKTAIVNPEGIALGLDNGPVFDRSISEVEIEMGAGDRLVLHTDGALKVQNGTGDEFGEARLYQAILQKAPMNSQAFVNFVGGAIDNFHMGTQQNDDITISTVKRLK